IEYCFTVNENVFNPPPKVKSAVIRLTRNSVSNLECDEVLFKKIVKAGFNQRRKTLRNALREMISIEIMDNQIFNKRAEQLSVEDFTMLTRLIENHPKLP
ncbi:MAG: 16S rRNA (adenine(1518)-N(6)/adenine(1519)-N(6))-dimethyltransferase, partial [Bacteroidales bacterium]|nr:16S rRNA (adenine(1518)-N(6)/adenine(1519)-N(6))-dimethyltransferase [Bacteroidales bacterium]